MQRIRLMNQSPFTRGPFPNPLTGSYLSWMSDLSRSAMGATGDGVVLASDGSTVGGYKAFGGLVWAWVYAEAGKETTIEFPSMIMRGPCFFSDDTIKWPNEDGKLTVIPSIDVEGWITYRG